jgi:cation-transporting ATPase 13A3/4/5
MFGLESIATVIPPLLPLALAVGQTVASDRLRRKAVFCLSLPRIALAGMVDVMCFDKTGANPAARRGVRACHL